MTFDFNCFSFKKGFNSFGIKKNMIVNRESVEFLYTLRLRNYFRPEQKIYTKNVSKYDVKFEFNLGDGEIGNNQIFKFITFHFY